MTPLVYDANVDPARQVTADASLVWLFQRAVSPAQYDNPSILPTVTTVSWLEPGIRPSWPSATSPSTETAESTFCHSATSTRSVRGLARALGVLKLVISKAYWRGLWEGQTDEAEIGVTYDVLDRALALFAGAETREPLDSARSTGLSPWWTASEHKRRPIPVFRRDTVDVVSGSERSHGRSRAELQLYLP